MNGRKRTVQIKFRVTEAERDLILEKMKLVPTRNMAAYLRKIAIDGYIIQIDQEYMDFRRIRHYRLLCQYSASFLLKMKWKLYW